jgi:two-component system OmpR family sensor kinase
MSSARRGRGAARRLPAGPGVLNRSLGRLSIRWRLALITAALTFAILCAFAVVVGQLTASRVRSDFNSENVAAAGELTDQLQIGSSGGELFISPALDTFAALNNAVIRIIDVNSGNLIATTRRAPDLGVPILGTVEHGGYRVVTRQTLLSAPGGQLKANALVQYARPVSDLENTITSVRLFLALGVFAGTGLALGGGLLLARRAMSPIAALTATAKEIAETRDPNRRVPQIEADDEVAELARTLDQMLVALEGSRKEIEGMLVRQREFVADASHELRTPLTSVLANLELLAEVLDGEKGEAARSALRSSQRMRRLVGDLLLLARADARREAPRTPTDLGQVVVEAAAELGPVADGHDLHVDATPATVQGARDELYRMALNLMENAVRHTPPGTHVRAHVVAEHDGPAVLTVVDDGPGVRAELRDRVFERFVRGGGDRSTSSGLGLSIVRAVAESHGGSVELQDALPGARFVVRLPRVASQDPARISARPAIDAVPSASPSTSTPSTTATSGLT